MRQRADSHLYLMVRRSGQVAIGGWSLVPIDATLDGILAKNLTFQGVVSHTWQTWERCLELMLRGRITTEPLVSDILSLGQWRGAFSTLEELRAIKILLHPEEQPTSHHLLPRMPNPSTRRHPPAAAPSQAVQWDSAASSRHARCP